MSLVKVRFDEREIDAQRAADALLDLNWDWIKSVEHAGVKKTRREN